jgi:hypothetical protein
MFAMEYGVYPPDANRGVVPDGMDDFLTKMDFTEPTPLGGLWDWDHEIFGVVAAISVAGYTAEDEQLKRLDKMIDDGKLWSGNLRQTDDRLMYVIEE